MGDIHHRCKDHQDDELSVLEMSVWSKTRDSPLLSLTTESHQSIYPGSFTETADMKSSHQRSLSLNIAIALSSPIATRLIDTQEEATPIRASGSDPSRPDSLVERSFSLGYLPSLSVALSLPGDYPLHSPPEPVVVRAPLVSATPGTASGGTPAAQWLEADLTNMIEDKLREMWLEEHEMAGDSGPMGVLWRWWQWVCQGEFLSDLGLFRADGSLE